MKLRSAGLLLSILALTAPTVSGQVGFGRTYGEAMMRAQQNAAGRAMWAQVGRDIAAYAEEKENLSRALTEAREQYWIAAAAGPVAEELEQHYQETLRQKDFHYLGLEFINHVSRGIQGSSTANLGTLIDGLTDFASGGRSEVEGIQPFAQSAFDDWIGHLKNLWPEHDFDLPAAMMAGRETYADYVERRDVAEYLFENPNTPLRADDNREFLVGWLLATNSSASFQLAALRMQAMLELVGQEAFDRAVEAARGGRLEPDGVKPNSPYDPTRVIGSAFRDRTLDWLATQHDPDLYAIQLIKRSTGTDWKWANAVHRARIARLGSTAKTAVQEAFRDASDPDADCVGDPNLQFDKTSRLSDCVADKLGPLTLWADAHDVAATRLDRVAMKARMLEHLATAPDRGDAETRYLRITETVDETALLASLHHQQEWGLWSLVGGEKRRGRWSPFEEELRIFEFFAAAREARSFAVLLLAQSEQGDPLSRLEQAPDSFQQRAASLGEDRLLSAARAVAQQVQPRRVLSLGKTYRQEIGEGAAVAAETQRELRVARVKSLRGSIGRNFTGLPFESPLFYHYRKAGLSADEAKQKITAHGERAEAAFATAVSALERYETNGHTADRQAGLEARDALMEEIESAHQAWLEMAQRFETTNPKLATQLYPIIEDEVGRLVKRIDGTLDLFSTDVASAASPSEVPPTGISSYPSSDPSIVSAEEPAGAPEVPSQPADGTTASATPSISGANRVTVTVRGESDFAQALASQLRKRLQDEGFASADAADGASVQIILEVEKLGEQAALYGQGDERLTESRVTLGTRRLPSQEALGDPLSQTVLHTHFTLTIQAERAIDEVLPELIQTLRQTGSANR